MERHIQVQRGKEHQGTGQRNWGRGKRQMQIWTKRWKRKKNSDGLQDRDKRIKQKREQNKSVERKKKRE